MRRPWLAPLVPLYAAGVALRDMRLRRGWEPVRRLAWPVISVGNLSTGGTGKTPFVIALARALAARGVSVDVLSRGYGRQTGQAAHVDPQGSAEQFGDEPLEIARAAQVPVYVATQRFKAGQLAEQSAARPDDAAQQRNASGQHEATRDAITQAHLLDDGFQHRQLARDVDIVLLNREDWNDTLLPAGNLREALRAVMRAQVLVIPAEDAELADEIHAIGWQGQLWHMRRTIQLSPIDAPVLAFCGIARPAQFFAGLEAAGLRIAARRAFRDHARYAAESVAALVQQARSAGAAALFTTQKDAVRLGSLRAEIERAMPLHVAQLTVEIDGECAAMDWLIARLAARARAPTL